MTTITDVVVTILLIGVVLAGVYTFMGSVFTESQIDSIKTNFTGVQSTVDEMISTSKDIKSSTSKISPTESKTGFLGTTINALAISARAVAQSIDSLGDMVTSIFRIFGISTSSVIYSGLVSAFMVIIVFTLLKAVKGDTG